MSLPYWCVLDLVSILRAARKVEASGDDLCPFTMIGKTFDNEDDDDDDDDDPSTEFGEGFEFDVVKTTKTLLESFGLMADAKHRPVELGLSSDGAQLTHTLSHVTAGLKFNDIGMQNPFTKQLMLFHGDWCLAQWLILSTSVVRTWGRIPFGQLLVAELNIQYSVKSFAPYLGGRRGWVPSDSLRKFLQEFICIICSNLFLMLS